jgi:mono/diheme cytochrome c family protein
MIRRLLIIAAFAGAAIWTAAVQAQMTGVLIVEVAEPRLSETGAAGKKLFDAECAACHGASGSGSDQGPPLIHRIYHPGHHGDLSFYRAVREGTRAHHWSFGDMAPQPQVRPADIPAIIRYIREVQAANGIR